MDFTLLTIDILKMLGEVMGNYGLGIILLTVLVRLALWPLGVSQQRSMRSMQLLQPKMKAIQERYASNPQMQQQKLMEFYKEHNFNPMAGCLPMLVQMPIFILLYTALMSPMFTEVAGNESFLFIKRLDTTLKGNAGAPYDNVYNVSKGNTFSAGKMMKIYVKGESEPTESRVPNPRKLIKVQGDIIPGETLDLKINLDDLNMKYSQLENVENVELDVINNATREVETVKFDKSGSILMAQVPTKEATGSVHYDVLVLIVLFAITMVASSKIMMAINSGKQKLDPTQAAMQKTMGTTMPIFMSVMFVFIPIPAGVFLYLISSNIIQVVQTIVINKQLEAEDEAKKKKNLDNLSTPIDAKKVEAKEVKNVEEEKK